MACIGHFSVAGVQAACHWPHMRYKIEQKSFQRLLRLRLQLY